MARSAITLSRDQLGRQCARSAKTSLAALALLLLCSAGALGQKLLHAGLEFTGRKAEVKQTALQPQAVLEPKGNRAINRLLREAHCEGRPANEQLCNLQRNIERSTGSG